MEKKAVIIDYLYSTWAPLRRNLHGKGYEVTHFDTLKEFISTRTFAGLGLGKPKPMLEISLAYSRFFFDNYDPLYGRPADRLGDKGYREAVNLGLEGILRLGNLLPNADIIVHDLIIGPHEHCRKTTTSHDGKDREGTIKKWEEEIKGICEENSMRLINTYPLDSYYKRLMSTLPSEERVE